LLAEDRVARTKAEAAVQEDTERLFLEEQKLKWIKQHLIQ
jgi:hypothetical protein